MFVISCNSIHVNHTWPVDHVGLKFVSLHHQIWFDWMRPVRECPVCPLLIALRTASKHKGSNDYFSPL